MTTVKGTRDLKHVTTPFAYVKNYDKIYQNVGGEWVEKKYFTSGDIEVMYGVSRKILSHMLGARPAGGTRIRLTLKEVRELFANNDHE